MPAIAIGHSMMMLKLKTVIAGKPGSHIYGYPLFCNTVFDAVFGLLSSIRRLSGVV
ncbi:hypothetical protein J2Y56_004518, partial [Pseudomonas sp. BE134]|nr:hypothetical protein [Pseudomonas sp. BE134]